MADDTKGPGFGISPATLQTIITSLQKITDALQLELKAATAPKHDGTQPGTPVTTPHPPVHPN